MKPESSRWIEAGKILSENPNAKVLCPKNLDAELVVTDESPKGHPEIVERHMRCPKCGAYNAIRLHQPELSKGSRFSS
jgi:hypothetical protein